MKIAIIKLFGNNPQKGTRKKIFVVLFNKKLSEDRLIKLAIEEIEELSEDRILKLIAEEKDEQDKSEEEKDEQDKSEELVFWIKGKVLRIFDESKIIDLTNPGLWEKIKELCK